MEIRYISIEEAREIHAKTIKYSGGGICQSLNLGPLEGTLVHIQNDDYYPTFEEKLTHLFFCTCKFHCFADGNKRLALTLSTQFLLLNGYLYAAKLFMSEMENISYYVAAGKIDKDLLSNIIHAILTDSYQSNEELKLLIYQAIK